MRQLEIQCGEEGLRDKAGGNFSLSGILRPHQTDQTTQVVSFYHCSFRAHSLGESQGPPLLAAALLSALPPAQAWVAPQSRVKKCRVVTILCPVSASGSE